MYAAAYVQKASLACHKCPRRPVDLPMYAYIVILPVCIDVYKYICILDRSADFTYAYISHIIPHYGHSALPKTVLQPNEWARRA